MRALGDRVVVITGASSGIGRATALACARGGGRVVLAAPAPASLLAGGGEGPAGGAGGRGGGGAPARLARPGGPGAGAVAARRAAASPRAGRVDAVVHSVTV